MIARGLPRSSCFILACILLLGPVGVTQANPPLPPVVDFNRDIRPIFAETCYQCHGPDKNKRKADLRLDTREGIFSSRDGQANVVPANPDQSELYRRITTPDKDERMPDPKSGKKLSERQIALVKKWIEQGAEWKGHWAYLKPVRPAVPSSPGGEGEFVKDPIDGFVLARLKESNLRPSPEADRATLIRRLSFDLTGLPPTRAEVDAFVNDHGPDAYEKVVDRLLASPHFGERMAMSWLDLVRYADSIGYHSDNPMPVSPYRDYVIQSFNDNKPFDQFTIEQLAGDLMPRATVAQKVASAYNRLLQTTEEGGAQPKEYEAKYAADRVRNVSTVWLGATMGCCQCHDHKFDPFTTRDFYSLAAFFADVKEAAVGRREPGMALPDPQQAAELKQLDEAAARVKRKLETLAPQLAAALEEWEKKQGSVAEWIALDPHGISAAASTILTRQAGTKNTNPLKGQALPPAIQAVLAVSPGKRSDPQKKELAAYYRTIAPLLQPLRDELAACEKRKAKLLASIPTVLVTVAGSPRVVRILPRGNWLDETGEVVNPAVPHFLPQPQGQGPRATRLDLARWIVSRDNPLTARVMTNRFWKLFFGQGLSKSLDDLGSQGEWPTHPELLDWLAVEFMDSGWDVKHVVKLLVMSGSYRQASRVNPELKERDPYNRLIARQSPFRLDAEMVRDNALAIAGLLSPRVGGTSVKPYQPAGYWDALNFPTRIYEADRGEDQYRRGLYTHWQRTFLHPSLQAFDAPSREECTCERPRSNIPQQALVLLNDPTYVEASRAFAARILKEGGAGVGDRLTWAYGCALSRKPKDQELKVLTELLEKHAREYRADKEAALKLVSTGQSPVPRDLDVAELAAWTSVARVILNLHETVTRY